MTGEIRPVKLNQIDVKLNQNRFGSYFINRLNTMNKWRAQTNCVGHATNFIFKVFDVTQNNELVLG